MPPPNVLNARGADRMLNVHADALIADFSPRPRRHAGQIAQKNGERLQLSFSFGRNRNSMLFSRPTATMVSPFAAALL